MASLQVSWVTEEGWEDAYEIFYRALKKLETEGKERFFGGMTPEGTKKSTKGENVLYLVYRKSDSLPVAAVSFVKDRSYQEYEDVVSKITKHPQKEKMAILNAIAVRPELWGQGYARQSLEICLRHLKLTGVSLLVGTVHPDNVSCIKTLKRVSDGCNVIMSDTYTWHTPRGRTFERRRFAFRI